MSEHPWSSATFQLSMTITDGFDAAREDFAQGGGVAGVFLEDERT
jgi:hypothetical protein